MSHASGPRGELLRRLREGDMEALANLFDHYRPRLKHVVQLRMDARLAARLDASDVVQEAYLDAVRQLANYLDHPRVDIYVWLRGLTWQRLLKLQRRHLAAGCRAVQRELPLPVDSSALLAAQLLARDPSPGTTALREEQRQRVQRALQQLPAKDREVILLRHFEGLSNNEVAQVLDLTPSGATMRHGRALFRLKELLHAEADAPEPEP